MKKIKKSYKFQTTNDLGEFNLSTEDLKLVSSKENDDFSVINTYKLDVKSDNIENWRLSQALLKVLGKVFGEILTASGDDDLFDNLPALHLEFKDLAYQMDQITELGPQVKEILSKTWDFAREILSIRGAKDSVLDEGPLFS